MKFVVVGCAHTDYSTKTAGEVNHSVRADWLIAQQNLTAYITIDDMAKKRQLPEQQVIICQISHFRKHASMGKFFLGAGGAYQPTKPRISAPLARAAPYKPLWCVSVLARGCVSPLGEPRSLQGGCRAARMRTKRSPTRREASGVSRLIEVVADYFLRRRVASPARASREREPVVGSGTLPPTTKLRLWLR